MESAGKRRSAEGAIADLRAVGFPPGSVRASVAYLAEGPCVRLTLPFEPPLAFEIEAWKRDGRPGVVERRVKLEGELARALSAYSNKPELARRLFDHDVSRELVELSRDAQSLRLTESLLTLTLSHENDDFRELVAIAKTAFETARRLETRSRFLALFDRRSLLEHAWGAVALAHRASFDLEAERLTLTTELGELEVRVMNLEHRESTLFAFEFSPPLPLGIEICEPSELGLFGRFGATKITDLERRIELFAKSEVSVDVKRALLELRAKADALHVSATELLCRVDEIVFNRNELETLIGLVLDAVDGLSTRPRVETSPYR